MLTVRIIPCLDVQDGRVVKGVKFASLKDAGDPVERAAAYEAQGADELTMLDISATPEGRNTALETVAAIRRVLSLPLTVGGGVRSAQDAQNLLQAGADKVGVNTAAVLNPELIGEIARRFGSQCAVLAIDAAASANTPSGFEVVIYSGKERTGKDAVAWAKQAAELGAGEILLTSWDRDGTRQGYDLALIGAIASSVTVPVIASGGADTVEHLVEAYEAGADAVLAASIFHYQECTVAELKKQLASKNIPVRI